MDAGEPTKAEHAPPAGIGAMETVFFVSAKLVGAILRPDTWILVALAAIESTRSELAAQ